MWSKPTYILTALAALVLPAWCVPLPNPKPTSAASGWIPSGSWSPPTSIVDPWVGAPHSYWSEYGDILDPAVVHHDQKPKSKSPPVWWPQQSSGTRQQNYNPGRTVTHQVQVPVRPEYGPPVRPEYGLPTATASGQYSQENLYSLQQNYLPLYPPTAEQYPQYQVRPHFALELPSLQVLPKKPAAYASLYPWVEPKPGYRAVPVHIPSPIGPTLRSPGPHGYHPGWTRIPVIDSEGGNQWIAWVPEDFGDFVIVRKSQVDKEGRPKKTKTVIEEEEEDDEPEQPKMRKKETKKKTVITEEEEGPERTKDAVRKVTKTTVTEEAAGAATSADTVTVPAPADDSTTSTTTTASKAEERTEERTEARTTAAETTTAAASK